MNTKALTEIQLKKLGIDIVERWNQALPMAPRIGFVINPKKTGGHYMRLGYVVGNKIGYNSLFLRLTATEEADGIRLRPKCGTEPVMLPVGLEANKSLERSVKRTEISKSVCAWIAAKYVKGEMV